jgi:hypothetical protein
MELSFLEHLLRFPGIFVFMPVGADPPKRPLFGIAVQLLTIFVTFFTLTFIMVHFVGRKWHPMDDPVPIIPSIVMATVVGLGMTIYLARSI